ncbi:hypothetical protein VTI74DRAFT_4462 [Chaetomium olivicolor]
MERARREGETAGNAHGSGCECYFNTAEIKQGQWQEDPSTCLRNCKVQFLRSALKGWDETSGWSDGCRSLNGTVSVREFWSLYWCDSTFCGVGIDPKGGLWQDPNVDLIINTCQNIGFSSVLDPGPPPPDFRCSTEADTQGLCSVTVVQVPAATPAPLPSTTQHPVTVSSASPVAATARSKPTPAVVASDHTFSSPTSTEGSASPSAASTTSGSNLTGQGKAAVAICSVLALIALVTFVLLCLRRRKKRKASFRRALRSRRGFDHAGPAGSPTPLISPASSAIGTRTILTPPLLLRDRKFLPSILRPGSRSPSPPLTPLTPAYSSQHSNAGAGVFPSSPICSPTTSKLVPRHERTGTPRAYPGYPPPLSTPESTFALPAPGMIPSHHHPWAHESNSNPNPNRGSASASGTSSFYAPHVPSSSHSGTSTAHSSLRHEIPIGIPAWVNTNTTTAGSSTIPTTTATATNTLAAATSTNLTSLSMASTPPPLPPAPPGSPGSVSASRSSLAYTHTYGPGYGYGQTHGHAHGPAYPYHHPARPPRPHEGMLEIPDLVAPATPPVPFGTGVAEGGGGSAGGGPSSGVGAGVGMRGVGGMGMSGTPPPPPPLSPPPNRALPPRPTPPPSYASSVRGSGASLAGRGTPPIPGVRDVKGAGRVGSGSVSAARGPPPGSGNMTGTGGGRFYHHARSASGYAPAESSSLAGRGSEAHAEKEKDMRGSWGSWSGTGTVEGAKCGRVVKERAHDEAKEETVSPRASNSSGVTATRETVSRMSSMKDDATGGGI